LASLPPLSLLQFAAGALLLLLGAELTVRNALRLAERARVRPLVAGLSLMALGSSAPQLVIGMGAVSAGAPDVALGSTVGGTLFNLLVTLGLCALIVPLRVSLPVVRLDLPMVIGAAALLYLLALDLHLGAIEAALLLAAWAAYLGVLAWQFRQTGRPAPSGPRRQRSPLAAVLRMAVGVAMLAVGGQWLLSATVAFANELGLSERVVGLTLVGVCASLPALLMSLLAAWRGERELAVGNVIGSSLCNLTVVLAITVLASPDGLSVSPNSLAFDLPVLLGATLVAWPLFRLGYRISRLEGLLLLALYGLYGMHLVAFSTDMPLAVHLERLLGVYVLPVLGVMVMIAAWRHYRGVRRR
jgi:cation:H+ antiporter